MINLLIFDVTAWADDRTHKEWMDLQKSFNTEDLMKGIDQNGNIVDLREQAHQDIDPEIFGASKQEVQNTLDNSADRPLHELENKGRAVRQENPEISTFLDELDRNTNDATPGVSKVKEDVEKIANDRAAIDKNLSKYLKEKYGIDIDCTSISSKAHNMQDDFIVGTEEEEVRDEVYEPQYCEHLSNTYDCITDLHLECLKKGNKSLQLEIKEANFGYHQEGNLIHINHHYYNESFSSSYGKSLDTYHILGIAEVRLVFNIRSLEIFNSLILTNINFSHAILIQFNNHKLYPGHWTDLKAESATPWSSRTTHKGKRYHMGSTRHSGGSIIYNDLYPHLDHGTGIIILNSNTRPNNHIGDIDLTRFIRPGHNELIIKGGSIGHNYIRAILRSFENTCIKWSEKWVETCVFQPS